MKVLKFKTNINCEGCIAKVTPFLNKEKMIQAWEVDTKTADKVLTVSGADIDGERVAQVLAEAGFMVKKE